MNLRLGNIKLYRRFLVVQDEVYEYDYDGELYYSFLDNEVIEQDGASFVSGSYLPVSYVGELQLFRHVQTVIAPARKGDVILITDGEWPRLKKVAEVKEDYNVLCQGENGIVKYGTYSIVVGEDKGYGHAEAKALSYLYKNGEEVATSLTYKIHEELRSAVPDYNKVNEMVRLVEYYREMHD